MIDGTRPYRLAVATRWNDNDVYGHLNNTVYYQAMDTAINTWMITVAGLDPLHGPALGFCVASSCEFQASAGFPDEIAVELSIARLGTTSVTWAPRILRDRDDTQLAVGTFTTVFVDRETTRPVPIPTGIRLAIESEFAVPAA